MIKFMKYFHKIFRILCGKSKKVPFTSSNMKYIVPIFPRYPVELICCISFELTSRTYTIQYIIM